MDLLLFSMPDATEMMPSLAIRMPNGALTSLAGNVDEHHRVAVADLILVQDRVRETVTRLVRDHRPDLVGLSVMTFQRRTALRLIALVRSLAPAARIVVGGYDPSLAADAYWPQTKGIGASLATSDWSQKPPASPSATDSHASIAVGPFSGAISDVVSIRP